MTRIETMNNDFDEYIRAFSMQWPSDFKSMLENAPLEGIEFDRIRDLERDVKF